MKSLLTEETIESLTNRRLVGEEVIHAEDVQRHPLEAVPVTVLCHLDARLHLFQRLTLRDSGGHRGAELIEILPPRGDVLHRADRSMARRHVLETGGQRFRFSDGS